MDEIVIKELSPALAAAYLAFFDQDAFTDNPHWASCYCYFPHAPHQTEDWETRTGVQNRAAAADLIGRGKMRGYLAFDGDRPVGWCNANIPRTYTAIGPIAASTESLGLIFCFVVAPAYRGRGVASRLLEAACEGFRRQGIQFVEAYPRQEVEGDAANYHGPLSMYLAAGFEPVEERNGIVRVRRRVGAAGS